MQGIAFSFPGIFNVGLRIPSSVLLLMAHMYFTNFAAFWQQDVAREYQIGVSLLLLVTILLTFFSGNQSLTGIVHLFPTERSDQYTMFWQNLLQYQTSTSFKKAHFISLCSILEMKKYTFISTLQTQIMLNLSLNICQWALKPIDALRRWPPACIPRTVPR